MTPLVDTLAAAGIGYAEIVVAEVDRAAADLPADQRAVLLAAVSVLLVKESGGGRNIYGHDAGAYPYAERSVDVEVTEANYAEYLATVYARDPSGKYGRNGVGPLQITYYTLQNRADELGGCWRPEISIRAGVEHFAGLVARYGVQEAFARWRGVGPDGEPGKSYAEHAMTLLPTWQRIVQEATVQIIHRAAWGARHDDGGGSAPLPASEVWLHHSAGVWPDLVWIDVDADGVEDDEERAMRALEDIGEQRFGRGISYTFVIMPSGRVYEGHSVDRLGAHTGGRNSVARAICYAGNYMIHQPTAAQLRSTALLLQHGVHQGWWRVAALRGGHRDVKPLTGDSVATDCPGNFAYAAIPEINRLAGGPLVTEEDDMAGEGANILAFTATGGPDTKAITTDANGRVVYPPGIDRTSVIGRVADMQYALTSALPELRALSAQILANQQDDLSAEDVLDRLDATAREEHAKTREQLTAQLNETLATIRADLLGALGEDREQDVDEFLRRLAESILGRTGDELAADELPPGSTAYGYNAPPRGGT